MPKNGPRNDPSEIYLTYHSNDREDEPLQNLIDEGYAPYAWGIDH